MSRASLPLAAALLAGLAGGVLGTRAAPDARPQEMPEPGPRHAFMKKEVGTWSATIKAFNALTGEEVTSRGTETNRYGPGRMTLITEFKGRFMGRPFTGHGILGFDDRGRLVASWTDDRSGTLRFLEGKVAGDGSHRVLRGESRHDGEVYKERHTVRYEGPDRRRFTIETQGSDGRWATALEITYARR